MMKVAVGLAAVHCWTHVQNCDWFFGSNKLNSSNIVQITQRIVTWMLMNRVGYLKLEKVQKERHNLPWMGHCRWFSSLMAIFDAKIELKFSRFGQTILPLHYLVFSCLLPARCRRPPGGHYNQSYIIIHSLATVDNKKLLLQKKIL